MRSRPLLSSYGSGVLPFFLLNLVTVEIGGSTGVLCFFPFRSSVPSCMQHREEFPLAQLSG